MNKKIIAYSIIILFMCIGFANVVADFNFDLNVSLGFDEADFNIFYSKVLVNDSLLQINEDNDDEFKYISDGNNYAEYYIINRSMKYNAIVNVICNQEVTIIQDDEVLNAGSVISGKVISPYNGEITCSLDSQAVESEEINENQDYQITLDSQGGVLNVSNFYYINGYPLGKLPVPIKEGKVFAGWFNSLNESEQIEVTSDSILDITTDLTLYAKYIDSVFDFGYKGREQEFIVPASGLYKLEVWGAQGGGSICDGTSCSGGGLGGYATGNIILEKSTPLYINVGGSGCTPGHFSFNCGGYNGGGAGSGDQADDEENYEASGGGGGATHIATTSRGVLVNYINNRDEVIIVAGGGGGASWYTGGGAGGGVLDGIERNFGQGTGKKGGGAGNNGIPGGGGGYYGGNYGSGANSGGQGSGGSGYIGYSLLTDKVMYCYRCQESEDVLTKTISTTCSSATPTENCSKSGTGYARITYLG